MATTIKYGDSNITSAVREYWDNVLQSKIYALSVVRNLAGSVRYITNYAQGVDKTHRWTKSNGITDAGDTIMDIANTDEVLPQVDYGVGEGSVTANHKGSFVKEKTDILQDQQGFVVPDIMTSLSQRMAQIENKEFFTLLGTTTNVAVNGASGNDNVAISLPEMFKGITNIKNQEGVCRYIILNHNTVQTVADELMDASYVGDSDFLRNHTVGRLGGALVIATTYAPDNTVYYLGEDAIRHFERAPYQMRFGRDNTEDIVAKFAIEARWGFGFDRSEMVVKSIFNGS